MTRYHYRTQSTADGYLARCIELEMEAEGATENACVENLRAAINERLTECDAVAPPKKPPTVVVELVLEAPEEVEPFGPGDPGGVVR